LVLSLSETTLLKRRPPERSAKFGSRNKHLPSEPVAGESADRILFVWQKYSAYGGAELLLERTMAALACRGYRIAIVSANWPDRGDGIEVIPCPIPPVPRAFQATVFARCALRAIGKRGSTVVQANQPVPGCNVLRTSGGVHAAYLRQRALFDGPLQRAWTRISPFHNNALRLERKTFADARLKAVIANSAMVVEEVVSFYGVAREHVHHIPNGVDLDRFRPGLRDEFRKPTRASLGLDDRVPVVLLVGSGYRRKGLVEAINAVATARSRPHLWVVGRESHPAAFEALAEQAGITDRFRIFGPRDDPRPWFGAADVVVLPSHYEPFGSVVLEAMAIGLPTVVSSACGAREVVEQLDRRLVFPVGDTPALAAAIDRAYELATQSGSPQNVRRIAEGYGEERMIDRMLAVYATVAGS
jgi:UDP-glucose:(heptosyl)LPS alpha-1,3-glucosyltransferase